MQLVWRDPNYILSWKSLCLVRCPSKYQLLPQILILWQIVLLFVKSIYQLLVSHLDLSFLLRFNTNRVREVVMSRESISFIMIVIELQKCFVFESYHIDITRIVDSYPPVGVDSSHLSVCFSFLFFFWILSDSTPSIVNDETLIFFGRVLPVPGPAMKRLCFQIISLPTMLLLEWDLTCQAQLCICYHQRRYRCLRGSSLDFLQQVLAESWSDHLSHPRSHVVIRPPDFT